MCALTTALNAVEARGCPTGEMIEVMSLASSPEGPIWEAEERAKKL